MAVTYTILTEAGQSIWDIAIQEYGDASAVWHILDDNPTLVPDLNVVLDVGSAVEIQTQPSVTDNELMQFFRSNKIAVNAAL
ncbi:MAG: hypothetical protein RL660_434 [Bacteroidota bacterium]|jgi:hypothetical protein